MASVKASRLPMAGKTCPNRGSCSSLANAGGLIAQLRPGTFGALSNCLRIMGAADCPLLRANPLAMRHAYVRPADSSAAAADSRRGCTETHGVGIVRGPLLNRDLLHHSYRAAW